MCSQFLPLFLPAGSDNTAVTGDIIMLCFKHVIARLNDSPDSSVELAAMIFPLLLVVPKVLSSFKKNMFVTYMLFGMERASLCVSCYIICCYLQTWKYNIKALEFAKKLNWAFYQNLPDACSSEKVLDQGDHALLITVSFSYFLFTINVTYLR